MILYVPNCIIIRIILRVALSCIDLRITSLVCVFGSSRVDTDTEQYEQEYEHTPQEDPACTATADLTGEPFLFTYFTFLLSLFLLSFGCDSFESRVLFHLLPKISRVSLPLPIAVVCLFASLASRSADRPMCCYLDLLIGICWGCYMSHRILC